VSSFNRVILLGNLTRDPAMKHLPSQTVVTEFGVACNRKFRTGAGEDREEVTYVDCTAFGKQGELINEHFQKGKPILLEGRLKFDQWEAKDGTKRSKLTVVVEGFQFVGGREQQDQGDDAPPSRTPMRDAARAKSAQNKGRTPADAFSDEPLDQEVPF
jgi:single-strand DNA-binding protein